MPGFMYLPDNDLAKIYLQLSNDFSGLLKENKWSPQEIYNEMYKRLYQSMNHTGSRLSSLPLEDKNRLIHFFNVFYTSRISTFPRNIDCASMIYHNQLVVITFASNEIYQPYYCQCNDDLFSWVMLNSMLSNLNWQNSQRSQGSSINNDTIAKLIVALLIGTAIVVAAIALYYLLNTVLDSLERFWHGEGLLRALSNISAVMASAFISSTLLILFGTMPLITFAIVVGVSNPVGVSLVAMSCLALMGTAVGTYLLTSIMGHIDKKINTSSLDPSDADRFSLTEAQQSNLEGKGFDIYKVTCALIALREQMGKKGVTSFLHRTFTSNGHEVQEHLNQLRLLKQGKIQTLDIGELHFDLLKTATPVCQVSSPMSLQYQNSVSGVPAYNC